MAFRILPADAELGWTPYGWLVYLAFLGMGPSLMGGAARDWVLTGVATLVFLVLYFRGFWLSGRRLLPVVGGIVLVGAVLWPVNPGASVFFIYASGFLGGVGPPRRGFRWMAVILAVLGAEAWLLSMSPQWWAPGMVFTVLVGAINIHYAEVRRANAKLRLAQEEVERLAATAERERIARDLHDLLGHTLSVITLKSELASKLALTDALRAKGEMEEVEAISRKALAQVRRAIRGYRAPELAAELSGARLACEAAAISLSVEEGPRELPSGVEGVAALALREAVTNVIRHSGAGRCTVRLEQQAARFRLVVEDDGRGGEVREGSGLAGMRERVEALGGRVERDGLNGMRLAVELPLETGPSGRAAKAAAGGWAS